VKSEIRPGRGPVFAHRIERRIRLRRRNWAECAHDPFFFSAEDPALVLTRRTSYRAAVAGFPAGFNAEGLQYFSNAKLSGLERRFDLL